MHDPTEPLEGRISLLNVGTRILAKDVMDQIIRSLGDFKTYYAPTLSSALRIFRENTIHVIFSEVEFPDGTAFRLIQALGGTKIEDDLYLILAVERNSPELVALGEELEAHSLLFKTFTAGDLKNQIERYRSWRSLPREPWRLLVREGHFAAREKKFREAEEFFKDAVESAPDNPGPLYKAALYYAAKPDHVVAEALLRKAIELNPNFIQAHSALGSLYLLMGKLDRADASLQAAQKLSPLNPDRPVEMVSLYVKRAIEACRSTLRMDSSGTRARLMLGKLLAVARDYRASLQELEKALPQLKDDPLNEANVFMALARKLGSLK